MRIEDPPRRRHMVFLGGAVLANLVSLLILPISPYIPIRLFTRHTIADTVTRSPTRRICGLPSKSGRNRVHVPWPSSALDSCLFHSVHTYVVYFIFNLTYRLPIITYHLSGIPFSRPANWTKSPPPSNAFPQAAFFPHPSFLMFYFHSSVICPILRTYDYSFSGASGRLS